MSHDVRKVFSHPTGPICTVGVALKQCLTGFGLISNLPEVEAVHSHLLPPSGQNQNSTRERVQIESEYKFRGLKASINLEESQR